MTDVSTDFTLLLDLQSSAHTVFSAFVEKIISWMSLCECRIRIAAYGVYNGEMTSKLLAGRYVATGEALRRQWKVLENVAIAGRIKRLDTTLALLFKQDADEVNNNSKRVAIIVSSRNWLCDVSYMSAVWTAHANGVEVCAVAPNVPSAVLALMRSCRKSLTRAVITNSRTTRTRRFTKVAPNDLLAFNANIVNGLLHFKREIDVTRFLQPVKKGGCGWSKNELGEHLNEVLWDNPLLFHVDKGFSVKTSRIKATGELVSAFLVPSSFTISAETYRERRRKVEQAAAIALNKTVGITNIAEKVKRLHDYLATHCQYAISGYGNETMEFRTVYDALVMGQAVCEGFAVCFNYLLSLAGIESKEVVSDVMQHCWNCVLINGNWYHVDVTFDNPIIRGRAGGITHVLTHDYFLLSDTALIARGKHHDWDRQHLPPITDTRFDHIKWD